MLTAAFMAVALSPAFSIAYTFFLCRIGRTDSGEAEINPAYTGLRKFNRNEQ